MQLLIDGYFISIQFQDRLEPHYGTVRFHYRFQQVQQVLTDSPSGSTCVVMLWIPDFPVISIYKSYPSLWTRSMTAQKMSRDFGVANLCLPPHSIGKSVRTFSVEPSMSTWGMCCSRPSSPGLPLQLLSVYYHVQTSPVSSWSDQVDVLRGASETG